MITLELDQNHSQNDVKRVCVYENQQ